MKTKEVSFETDCNGTFIIGGKRLSGGMPLSSALLYLATKAGAKFPTPLEPDKKLTFKVTITETTT